MLPSEAGGFVATLQLSQPLSEASWEAASKYMRRYARESHWKVHELARRKGYVELHIEHSVPKPKKKLRRGGRPTSLRTEECTPQDQAAPRNLPPSTTS